MRAKYKLFSIHFCFTPEIRDEFGHVGYADMCDDVYRCVAASQDEALEHFNNSARLGLKKFGMGPIEELPVETILLRFKVPSCS